MAQENWRNNASRVRMRDDATPPSPEQKNKAAANSPITRAEIVIVALLMSIVVGLVSYESGERRGAANVASVTQPMTLEELRDKYGSQEWATGFDEERVVAMWDEPRRLMSYIHLTYDDYAALCGERSNWTREDRFSAMVSAAIRRREWYQLSISNPLKK